MAHVPKAERRELIALAFAERPFSSARQLADELSHHGMSSRTWSREIAAFLDDLGASRGTTISAQRGRQLIATENLIQQIIDGRKGNAGALLRLHAQLTGTLDHTAGEDGVRRHTIDDQALAELKSIAEAWRDGSAS